MTEHRHSEFYVACFRCVLSHFEVHEDGQEDPDCERCQAIAEYNGYNDPSLD